MTYTKLMKKGEVMEIGYMLTFGVSIPEDTNITYAEYQMGSDLNDELMRNIYSYQEGMSWRDMVLSLLIAAILSVTSVHFLVALLLMWIRHRNYRKRGLIAQDVRFRPLPIVRFFLAQQIFLTKEFYTALYSLRPVVVDLFKIAIGLLILVIAIYGYRRKRDRFHKLILYSVILLTGADIMMTTSIEAGAALYRAGHAGKHRKRRYAAGRYAGTNGQGGTTGIKRKTPFAGVFRFIRCRLGRLLCASDAAKI